MIIHRTLEEELKHHATMFPVVAVLGPRQSGKTTLARSAFDKHTYVNLELPKVREKAEADPDGFLASLDNPHGIILDEVQNLPVLFSYIQVISDERNVNGYYILTGSHNYLLNEKISQSLAGRVAINTLLPLSIRELSSAELLPQNVFDLLYKGMYPRIQNNSGTLNLWYQSYIKAFVERDIRLIKNVSNLTQFTRFITLCAGRIGQVVNFSSLASDTGISVNTARAWLSLLESSYILFRVETFANNVSKRHIKSPKIYFYDTGLACNLLSIYSAEQLRDHYLQGGLFESFVFSELAKGFYNRGIEPPLHFWRDRSGREVDCIIEYGARRTPIEIKGVMTPKKDHFAGLSYWNKRAGNDAKNSFIIYAGTNDDPWHLGTYISWRNIDSLIDHLIDRI